MYVTVFLIMVCIIDYIVYVCLIIAYSSIFLRFKLVLIPAAHSIHMLGNGKQHVHSSCRVTRLFTTILLAVLSGLIIMASGHP